MTRPDLASDPHLASGSPPLSTHVIAGIVVDELIRNGVRRFLYCPGSRNGPIGFELARRAQTDDIELHVRLDERVAGFTALGMSKATHRPVAVVTTSGSAVTNLLPSVTEASYSNVPMVVLSANRPVTALGTGASQTIEQVDTLRSQTRDTLQLTPDGSDSKEINASLRSQICRGLLVSQGALAAAPGPVHFDLPLDNALPPTQFDPDIPCGKEDAVPWVLTAQTRTAIREAPRHGLHPHSLVIAGDGANMDLIPARTPIVAEPTTRLRDGQQRLHPWLLDYITPAEAVVIGRPTLHGSVQRLLSDRDVRVQYVADETERWLYSAPALDAIVTAVAPSEDHDDDWSAHLAATDRTIRDAWAAALGDTETAPCGAHIVRAVTSALTDADILWLGASNTIRDAALVTGELPRCTLSNRGTAGIDGNLASAIGVALSHPHRHITAVLGDLAFLYDASALQFGQQERVPSNLTVVVVNDTGGGIFELLEQGAPAYKNPPYGSTFERIYGTPQNTSIAGLCDAYAVRHRTASLAQVPSVLCEEQAPDSASSRCTPNGETCETCTQSPDGSSRPGGTADYHDDPHTAPPEETPNHARASKPVQP